MNKPISYPLAKLLKEKEYHEECWQSYRTIEHTEDRLSWWKVGELNKPMYCKLSDKNDAHYGVCSAPTIADVVMWLYEKHDIWIVVFPTEENWTFDIFNKIECVKSESFINSPTEAYEAAIEYTLTKLI